MSSTQDALIQRYGTQLLSLEQVAEQLHRSRDGLRVTLGGNSALATRLNSGKVKIGKRLFFKIQAIADLIDGQ